MTCIDCGHQTTGHPSYCIDCGGNRFQNTDSMDGFWGRSQSATKQGKHSLSYDYSARKPDSSGFFSGWWPLKLLFFPVWVSWKVVRVALSNIL